jgi:membrane-bound serine protease (ClpP class)
MNWTTIVILTVTGAALIAVDFYLPNFVLGTIGIVLMLSATLLYYGDSGSVDKTVIVFFIEVALGIGAGYASIRYFPKTATGKKMILKEAQTVVRAQSQRASDWVGRTGVAQTVLRPAGAAVIDGKRLDVVAESDMIEGGSPITVVAVQDNRLVVRKLS